MAADHHKESGPLQATPQPPNITQEPRPLNQSKQSFRARKQGKTYPPKKKKTPQHMRQHIHAIIEESFDSNSQEYHNFVKEVEEKGF
jgi:hypothetical protein